MINILGMLLCFCLLIGIAMAFYKFTRLTGVESTGLSVAAIVLVQLVCGILGDVSAGSYILYAAGIAGAIAFFLPFHNQRKRSGFFSPGLLFITGGFVYSLFAFQNSIIHNTDELIQWAKAARYVYDTGHLPVSGMFSGVHPAGTTLFHHFFIRMTGYVESNLYCSGFLMTWTGLMLPLSSLSWKDLKQSLLYAVTVFLALYALYIYPYMSINVDMPVAVWAGGMAALWYLREKRKESVPLLAGVLFLLPQLKWAVGPMMAAALIFFVLLIHMTASELPVKLRFKTMGERFKKKSTWAYCLLPLIAVGSLYLWHLAVPMQANLFPDIRSEAVSGLFSQASDRTQLTVQAGIEAAFTKNLGASGLNVTYLSFLVAFNIIGVALYFFLSDRYKNYRWIVLFYLLGGIAYFYMLMLNYLNTFSYNESIRVASIYRYFSIYVLFGLPLLLSPLLAPHPEKKVRVGENGPFPGAHCRIVLWDQRSLFYEVFCNRGYRGYSELHGYRRDREIFRRDR